MRKIFFALAMIAGINSSAEAQIVRFGIKAGPNFANFSGDVNNINYKSRTSFHAGIIAEIKTVGNFAIQPEVLYSSQGAEVDGVGDFNLDYVSVPVMAKYYILADKLSLEAGPQFSFLVNERDEAFTDITTKGDNNAFDLALAGGVGLDITNSFFAQARYTIGLTDASEDAKLQNAVFQLSLGYKF